jgi:hypothetical protein
MSGKNMENDEEDLLSKIQKLAVESSSSSSLSRDDKWWQEFGWTKWNGKEPTMSVRNERRGFYFDVLNINMLYLSMYSLNVFNQITSINQSNLIQPDRRENGTRGVRSGGNQQGQERAERFV